MGVAIALAACGRDNGAATPTPPPQAATAIASAQASASPAASASTQPTASANTLASASPAASGQPSAAGNAATNTAPSDLNVLLISIDSLRADMPWSGYARDIAPSLTAFEKTAVSYTHAYSISSYTAMSLGGFLAGKYPSEIARSGYFFSSYPNSVTYFPELLQQAGVRTLAAHAHFYFEDRSGFRQGFDDYRIVPGLKKSNTTDENITSPKHVALAKEMLGAAQNNEKRFFAWFHFLDPHDMYMPHSGIGPYGKSERDKYDAEVTYTDQHVGEFIKWVDEQPWGKRTAIIITADHGEAFGEHKLIHHGFELYEPLIRIPLMIRAPGITPHRIDTPRSTIDLAPTIMAFTGAPIDPGFQGKSLAPEVYGAEPEAREVVADLPRTGDNDRRRAFIKGDYKIITYGDDEVYEMFDIAHDPEEKTDIKKTKEGHPIFEQMKAAYKARVEKIIDVCPRMTDKLKGKRKSRKC
jgi:hypothetical protein